MSEDLTAVEAKASISTLHRVAAPQPAAARIHNHEVEEPRARVGGHETEWLHQRATVAISRGGTSGSPITRLEVCSTQRAASWAARYASNTFSSHTIG